MTRSNDARAIARRLLRERDELQKKYSLSLEQLSYWMTLYELTVKERDEARAENARLTARVDAARQLCDARATTANELRKALEREREK